MSKLMNVCIIKTHFFRWSDRHTTLPMVLVPQVVMTHHRTTLDTDRGTPDSANRRIAPAPADAAVDGPAGTTAGTKTSAWGQS
jgi:hypothetical protein